MATVIAALRSTPGSTGTSCPNSGSVLAAPTTSPGTGGKTIPMHHSTASAQKFPIPTTFGKLVHVYNMTSVSRFYLRTFIFCWLGLAWGLIGLLPSPSHSGPFSLQERQYGPNFTRWLQRTRVAPRDVNGPFAAPCNRGLRRDTGRANRPTASRFGSGPLRAR